MKTKFAKKITTLLTITCVMFNLSALASFADETPAPANTSKIIDATAPVKGSSYVNGVPQNPDFSYDYNVVLKAYIDKNGKILDLRDNGTEDSLNNGSLGYPDFNRPYWEKFIANDGLKRFISKTKNDIESVDAVSQATALTYAVKTALKKSLADIPVEPESPQKRYYQIEGKFLKPNNSEMLLMTKAFNPVVKLIEENDKATYIISFEETGMAGLTEAISKIKVDKQEISSFKGEGKYVSAFKINRNTLDEKEIHIQIYINAMSQWMSGKVVLGKKTEVPAFSIEEESSKPEWKQDKDGSWYVIEKGEKKKGWYEDKETYPGWYFFDQTGKMKTGWQYDESYKAWFYFATSGKMETDWIEVAGSWYYLENSGKMKTEWLQLGNAWYYLKSSGAMTTGWEQVDGAWYYFENGGAMKTGWMQLGNTWYYLKSSGAMATDWEKINGIWYKFASNGTWLQ